MGCDLLAADRNHIMRGTGAFALGAKNNTKAGRPQCASFPPVLTVGNLLIAALTMTTAPNHRLAHLAAVAALNVAIRRGFRFMRIPALRTARDARAGWATALHMSGIDFAELRERGRWHGDSSLRIYLDVLTASAQEQSVEETNLSAAAAYLQEHLSYCLCRLPPTHVVGLRQLPATAPAPPSRR
jgi:hypothetical protein